MRAIRPIHAIVPAAALAVAGFISLGQQAYGETRTFDLKGFVGLEASAGVKVIFKQGPYAVTAEEPDGRFDNLRLEVKDGVLFAGRKGATVGRGPRYTITVSAPDVSKLGVSSGASLDAAGISALDLALKASSGAHATVSGTCKTLTLGASSGASVDADGLKCESAVVDASSGAHAEAFATQTAAGEASSGASVTFHGQPVSFTKDTSSGGSVRTR